MCPNTVRQCTALRTVPRHWPPRRHREERVRVATGEGTVRVGREGPKIASFTLRRVRTACSGCCSLLADHIPSDAPRPGWARSRCRFVRPLEPFAHLICLIHSLALSPSPSLSPIPASSPAAAFDSRANHRCHHGSLSDRAENSATGGASHSLAFLCAQLATSQLAQ